MIVSGSLAELYIKISAAAAAAGGSNSMFTRRHTKPTRETTKLETQKMACLGQHHGGQKDPNDIVSVWGNSPLPPLIDKSCVPPYLFSARPPLGITFMYREHGFRVCPSSHSPPYRTGDAVLKRRDFMLIFPCPGRFARSATRNMVFYYSGHSLLHNKDCLPAHGSLLGHRNQISHISSRTRG